MFEIVGVSFLRKKGDGRDAGIPFRERQRDLESLAVTRPIIAYLRYREKVGLWINLLPR